MTDMIELARRLCMGEHIPPLQDGPALDDEHPTSERRMEEAERRARAESEAGDVEPWSAQP
jgi:hypothetical protein